MRRTYTDDDLARAVADSLSWRGVLRTLGLKATSSAAIRSVRLDADRLELDYRHFNGLRRWTEDQLAEAVAGARTWSEVAKALGLTGVASETALKGHAARLAIKAEHLRDASPSSSSPMDLSVDLHNLRRAGSLLAAAWFTLCGHDVAWPLEPCRYDLLVTFDQTVRVQVKSTTARSGGSWIVWLSNSRKGRITYAPDEIDYFFVIDGDLSYYLIPIAAVGGFHAIHLAAYGDYRVPHPFGPAPDGREVTSACAGAAGGGSGSP